MQGGLLRAFASTNESVAFLSSLYVTASLDMEMVIFSYNHSSCEYGVIASLYMHFILNWGLGRHDLYEKRRKRLVSSPVPPARGPATPAPARRLSGMGAGEDKSHCIRVYKFMCIHKHFQHCSPHISLAIKFM